MEGYLLSTFSPKPRRIAWIVGIWKRPALQQVLFQIASKAALGMGSSVTPPALVHFRRMGLSSADSLYLKTSTSSPGVICFLKRSSIESIPNKAPSAIAIWIRNQVSL